MLGVNPDRLFHVTFLHRLPALAKHGLVPDAPAAMHGWMQSYSAGKLFLTAADGVPFWAQRLADHAHDRTDQPEAGWAPVVLRVTVPRADRPVRPDTEGTRGAGQPAWFVTKPIPGRALAVWDGTAWVAVTEADVEGMQAAWWGAGTYAGDEEGEGWWELDFDFFLPPKAELEAEAKENPSRSPPVDWYALDNWGGPGRAAVAQYLGLVPDRYLYAAEVPLELLHPQLVEEQSARETRRGETEIEAWAREQAQQLLDQYNSSSFYQPELDKYRDWLVPDYDEEDVRALARELQAREQEYSDVIEEDLPRRGSPPPPILRRTGVRDFVILDGNHRVRFWQQAGYELVLAWLDDAYARRRELKRLAYAENPGRTLYHGTLRDNLPSIRDYGLLPILGDFVADAYGTEYALAGGEDTADYDAEGQPVLHGVVFAADKNGLERAARAMIYHVGKKLGKDTRSVTREDLISHGLLAIIRDVTPASDRYRFEEATWYRRPEVESETSCYAEYPGSVEPGDWFMIGRTPVDDLLTGRKMVRFLERQGAFTHAAWDERRRLIRWAVQHHGEDRRQEAVAQARSIPDTRLGSVLERVTGSRGRGPS